MLLKAWCRRIPRLRVGLWGPRALARNTRSVVYVKHPRRHRLASCSINASSITARSSHSGADNNSKTKITQDDWLFIYVDGSCQGNQNVATNKCPAGWGAVVVLGCTGRYHIIVAVCTFE